MKDGFVHIRGPAMGRRGSEGTIPYQLSLAEQELAKRKREDGKHPKFRSGDGEGPRDDVLGRKERVPSLLPAPGREISSYFGTLGCFTDV